MTIEELKAKGLTIRASFIEGHQRHFVIDLLKPKNPIVEWGYSAEEAWAKTIRLYTTHPDQFHSEDVRNIWGRWLPTIPVPDEEWLERIAANADPALVIEACRATSRKHKNDPFASTEGAHKYMYACVRRAKEERAATSPPPSLSREITTI